MWQVCASVQVILLLSQVPARSKHPSRSPRLPVRSSSREQLCCAAARLTANLSLRFPGTARRGHPPALQAKQETGLPIVTEIMSYEDIDLFEQVDLIQVGARNMQNFELLKRLGKQDKPILLKRGLANTIEEFLMSAEYIMAQGNEQVILCERGIRTFENATRNTLDLSAVPLLKKRSHLPVVVDPSHATGIPWMVEPMTLAAIAAEPTA